MVRAWTSRLAITVAAACLLTACSQDTGHQGQILRRGNTAEPLTLDPQRSNGIWENHILGDMFIGLFTENVAGEPVPGMAESWSVSEDGLVWVFELREAFWSDGEPVTAYDFEYAFQRILDPGTVAQYATILHLFKNAQAITEGAMPASAVGVNAIDAHTLRIELEYPAPYLPGLLAHVTTYPIPRHVVDIYGDAWVQPNNIVVNGPYRLSEWRSNEFIRLERNARFFDNANVCMDEVFYYPTPNSILADRMVRAGDLDVNIDFSGDDLNELRQTMPDYVRVHPWVGLVYFSFNTETEMFGDQRVREALSLALDREHITQDVTGSGEIAAYSFVPPGMNDYESGARMTWADQSLEDRRARAVRLLTEAGYGPENPLSFVFQYRAAGHSQLVAREAEREWEALASWVDVGLESSETSIHYADLRAGDFQFADSSWIGDYNDAYNFLYLAEGSTGGMNYSNFADPEYDALLAQANRTNEPQARASLMMEAEQILLNEQPYIPVYFQVNKSLVNPDLTGWEDNLFHIHRSRFLCWNSPNQD